MWLARFALVFLQSSGLQIRSIISSKVTCDQWLRWAISVPRQGVPVRKCDQWHYCPHSSTAAMCSAVHWGLIPYCGYDIVGCYFFSCILKLTHDAGGAHHQLLA